MGSQHESGFLHVIAQKTGRGKRGRMNFTERACVFLNDKRHIFEKKEAFLCQLTVKNNIKSTPEVLKSGHKGKKWDIWKNKRRNMRQKYPNVLDFFSTVQLKVLKTKEFDSEAPCLRYLSVHIRKLWICSKIVSLFSVLFGFKVICTSK